MNEKKVVLFDIDNTLFDTALFIKRMYEELAQKLHTNVDELLVIGGNIYKEVHEVNGYFDPEAYADKLAKTFHVDKQIILDTIYSSDNFKNGLYEETVEVLEEVGKVASIGIFSKGFSKFQQAKISAIKHLFSHDQIHIEVNKNIHVPDIIKKYGGAKLILVDDALEVLYEANKLKADIVTIWVKRGRYALNQQPIDGFLPTSAIDDLKSVVEIVRQSQI